MIAPVCDPKTMTPWKILTTRTLTTMGHTPLLQTLLITDKSHPFIVHPERMMPMEPKHHPCGGNGRMGLRMINRGMDPLLPMTRERVVVLKGWYRLLHQGRVVRLM